MKIVYLIDNFLPHYPTSPALLTLPIAKEMLRRGHDVYIICTVQDKNLAGASDFEGLKIRAIFTNRNIRWQAYFCLYNPDTVGLVKKFLNEIKPDVCHFHNVHGRLSYYCLLLAKKAGSKVFITCHDVMAFNYGKLIDFIDPNDLSVKDKFNYRVSWFSLIKTARKRYNPLRNIFTRFCLRYADKIFAVSGALREALNQNKILNVDVLNNALNLEAWTKIKPERLFAFKSKFNLENRPIIFFGGRLSGAKGGGQLAEAFLKVKEIITGAVLLVVGARNNYSEALMRTVNDKNLAGSIIFTDWLGDDDLKAAYAASNLAVVPSVCFDSFPTINLEAMAYGKPVIATCFGGSREAVIDGQTGFIVNPYDIEILADKIVLLLNDNELSGEFGKRGQERVYEFFNLPDHVDLLQKYYQM